VQHDQDKCPAQATERPDLFCEEVRTEHDVGVSGLELSPGQPGALGRWRQAIAAQDVGHAIFGDGDVRLAEFALDASIAPRVLSHAIPRENSCF
jgi:hypothetical protein